MLASPAFWVVASIRERARSSERSWRWRAPPGPAVAGIVTAGLRIGLLGPVEARRGESLVRISAAKQRVVLALLALRCGEVVSVDALVDGLWPGGPPATALKTVQGYVSALRRALDHGGGAARSVIVTRPPGYVLDVPAEAIDLLRFEQLWKEGHDALRGDDAERASRVLAEALSLWRGEPLVDIVMQGRISLEASLLDEMRLSCTEDYADAELACGRQESVVSLLDQLTAEHPFRERLAGQFMLALYRCGRQAEALGAYRSLYVRLSEELAVSPSPALVALERSILNHDPALLHSPKAGDTARAGGAPSALLSREDPGEPLSSSQLPMSTVTSVRRSERKVVSVMFCDLVGYTATAYSQDPEDVSRMLTAYHDQVRAEVERHGGVVEKFIGDAAVGLWGAPRAHEDDAERAVRAALALVETISFDVRVAVNTGEVLATVADSGEVSVIGDVINTAARLQTVAPTGGIVVGEGTLRATRAAITYDELGPVELKGIPEPVALWRVVSARSVAEGRDTDTQTPFVGRERELRLLQDVFGRASAEPGVQLVTITGEPGIGKTRLAVEFGEWLSINEPGVVVRRGRCLPYGEGIGFWALGEIVKTELGIDETATRPVARSRLTAATESLPDAPWIRTRLAPLVGLPGEGGEREEIFAAWQAFLEARASAYPMVMVFEDVHWADAALLEFIRHVAERSSGVCMLVVCTSRPELLEAHPEWAGGLTNATSLSLRPLKADEVRPLIEPLLAAETLRTADATEALIRRCGGNPLYALEYARLLGERPTSSLADIDTPQTIQAVITARLDTLTDARKLLLYDAAVIGKVFWARALAAISGLDDARIRAEMHELVRKELIRRSRSSAFAGDEEYVFWHDLIRDVAYGQIPRADRAERHRRTAGWLEAAAGDRLADRAELIAHHWRQALELLTAIGDTNLEPARRAAVRWATDAGEQTIGLDRQRARRLFESALGLSQPGDAETVRVLSGLAESATLAGEIERAYDLAQQTRAAAESGGDPDALGAAYVAALLAALFAGDRPIVERLSREGLETLEPLGPTPHLGQFLVWVGVGEMLQERWAPAKDLFQRAGELATAVDDPQTAALALNMHGVTRSQTGDRDGLSELQRSHESLRAVGSRWTPVAKYQIADQILVWDGPVAAAPYFEEAIRYAHRIRDASEEMWARAENTWRLSDQGDWDALLQEADIVLEWAAEHAATQHELLVAPYKARVLALRGDLDEARGIVEAIGDRARKTSDKQVLAPTLAVAALTEHLQGDPSRAAELLAELDDGATSCWAPTAEICRLLIAAGDSERAHRMIDVIAAGPPRLTNAIPSVRGKLDEARERHSEATAQYQDAVKRWRKYGHVLELAHALAGASRSLRRVGHLHEAEPHATEARTIVRDLRIPNGVMDALDLLT